ncbi:MAG: hypothetical protein IPL61_12955 [Myxococcales bacterium]|nr:hypothetical protein [Myxococcales bacterium]
MRYPGETAPTARGVLDLLGPVPYYLGPAGPLSNAQFVATWSPGPRRFQSCGRYSDGRTSANAKIEVYDRDVKVRDRFTGAVVATRHFAAQAQCARSFSSDTDLGRAPAPRRVAHARADGGASSGAWRSPARPPHGRCPGVLR